MLTLVKTNIGRLRLLAFLEGTSLLVLVFIAVPMKYGWNHPGLVKAIGPIHGVLFLVFVINTISVAVEQRWKFSKITWKILLACFIPFGTFYIDAKFLKPLSQPNGGGQ